MKTFNILDALLKTLEWDFTIKPIQIDNQIRYEHESAIVATKSLNYKML